MGIQVVGIHVDVHEPQALVSDLRYLGAEVHIDALPIADYRTTAFLVERKTIGELRPFLLVEGASLDAGSVSPAAIRGALLAVGENGVTVLRSEDAVDSALWLFRIACRATRPQRQRPIYAQRRKARTQEAVLAAIPEISTVSAQPFSLTSAASERSSMRLTPSSGT